MPDSNICLHAGNVDPNPRHNHLTKRPTSDGLEPKFEFLAHCNSRGSVSEAWSLLQCAASPSSVLLLQQYSAMLPQTEIIEIRMFYSKKTGEQKSWSRRRDEPSFLFPPDIVDQPRYLCRAVTKFWSNSLARKPSIERIGTKSGKSTTYESENGTQFDKKI